MFAGLPGVGNYEYNGMSAHHGMPPNTQLRLETHGLPLDLSGGLRTAPVLSNFNLENLMFGGGNTVNPAQLHLADPSPFSQDDPLSPFGDAFQGLQNGGMLDHEGGSTPDWFRHFDSQMSFGLPNESAIDQSSPSVMDADSPVGMGDLMMDPTATTGLWASPIPTHAPPTSLPTTMGGLDGSFHLDLSQGFFSEVDSSMSDDFSSKPFLSQKSEPQDQQFQPAFMNGFMGMPSTMAPGMWNTSALSDVTSTSTTSSHRHSSVTSVSTDTITDATRQALLSTLTSQTTRKYSQPSMTKPLSPRSSLPNLPGTQDLQRYVSAYFRHFHPHYPFLHPPTLKFDSPAFTSSLQAATSQAHLGSSGITGGGGCLILAMAAIGAFYEMESAHSKELFEAGHKVIQLYLDERRRADLTAALHKTKHAPENGGSNTPLWLVQAMLLNVIYGFNCGDKLSQEIASNHCSALVSLAKSAELSGTSQQKNSKPVKIKSENQGSGADELEWQNWKLTEERNRTFFTIYILSSYVVSTYNQAPSLNNSEVKLKLPCSEDLWGAESAQQWRQIKTTQPASDDLLFADALGWLIQASQREQNKSSDPFAYGAAQMPDPEIKPSEFGCLILINALHNYIWDTRQRHVSRTWTQQEFETMYGHIEPALRAWQTLWGSIPHHSLERPNPFGGGPITADCVPLLDLAYVRLFVNFGRSKEAFWQRDFVLMAAELESAVDVANSESSPTNDSMMTDDNPLDLGMHQNAVFGRSNGEQSMSRAVGRGSCLKKERMLRRAACYAADSLSVMDSLGLTYFDRTSHQLPLQCALCVLDCSQVLAEWITCVQERVGPFLGILSKEKVDFTQVPGIMLLEDEDTKLIAKINELLNKAMRKASLTSQVPTPANMEPAPISKDDGYGTAILMVTARSLERASVWPVMTLMAQALETQARRMRERTLRSAPQPPPRTFAGAA